MSVIHQGEFGHPADRLNSPLKPHSVHEDIAPSEAIVQLLSNKTAFQGSQHHASPATSQATNTEYSGISTQESSLSSQEMMPDSRAANQANSSTKSVVNWPNTFAGNPKSAEKPDIPQSSDMNGKFKLDSSADREEKSETLTSHRGILGPAHKLDTTAGQKRMANGEIKSSSSVSPINHLGFELSQLSNASPQESPQRSPQIGQLTAKLRTRLTYAMVKVQNGWESKNINEVESLAARQRSPRLSTTISNSPTNSPHQKLLASPEQVNCMRISPHIAVGGKGSPDSLSSSSGASEIGDPRYASLPGTMRPSLAPPVDLGPRNPRRSNPRVFAPPAMDPKPNSNLSDTSTSSYPPRINATPPTIHRQIDQVTGSQHPSTSMEQDAIETLLFMSSPGNAPYRPSSQQDTASAHPRPSSQLKKSTLAIPSIASKIPNTDAIPVSPRKKIILDEVDLGSDQQIDKVLDALPRDLQEEEEDTSSDEDQMH